MIYINTAVKPVLFIDFDSTIYDSILRICDMYNAHYRYSDEYTRAEPELITRYDFSDVCPLASHDVISSYFDHPDFFKPEGYWMTQREPDKNRCLTTQDYLGILNRWFHIVIVSIGTHSNLTLKNLFIIKYLPYANFIGIEDTAKDKSAVDMSNGVFVDNDSHMLLTSTAAQSNKILFGERYPWDDKIPPDIEYCETWKNLYDTLVKEYV